MTDTELITALRTLRDMMISVSTGGPRIDDVNAEFQEIYEEVDAALRRRNIANTIPYDDLWVWYGRWSGGDLPTYKSRRLHVGELVTPLIDQVKTVNASAAPATGWARVDRSVGAMREQLAIATAEEQFQTVGLLCREILISLAQAVYDADAHPTEDGVKPSETDAKRMLQAYIAQELSGNSQRYSRKHASSALDMSNALQHRRTANFRDAALCAEATTAVVNVIAIVAGRRDP